MQEGGERMITVPPALAYANKKMPGIPPNSTLHFGTYRFYSGLPSEFYCMLMDGVSEVKLLSIK